MYNSLSLDVPPGKWTLAHLVGVIKWWGPSVPHLKWCQDPGPWGGGIDVFVIGYPDLTFKTTSLTPDGFDTAPEAEAALCNTLAYFDVPDDGFGIRVQITDPPGSTHIGSIMYGVGKRPRRINKGLKSPS